jgi:hypothetical protein
VSAGAWRVPVLATLLFAATFALYWRTGEFAFLNYDDDVYVTANEHVTGGPTAANLRWALVSGHAANWHPLTWASHQLDVAWSGLDAGAHHRTSAVLHALNAALCFLALRALTGATVRSALVAALFARCACTPAGCRPPPRASGSAQGGGAGRGPGRTGSRFRPHRRARTTRRRASSAAAGSARGLRAPRRGH